MGVLRWLLLLFLQMEHKHSATAFQHRSLRLASLSSVCNPNAGWVAASNGCLFIGQVKQNWTESQKSCKAEDPVSNLVSIPSHLYDSLLPSMLSKNIPYWVGYNFSHGWMDGSSEVDITRFNDSTGGQNRCGKVEIFGNATHYALQWQLDDCHSLHPFICMINKSGALARKPASLRVPALRHRRERKPEYRLAAKLTVVRRYAAASSASLSRHEVQARAAHDAAKLLVYRDDNSSLRHYSRKNSMRSLQQNLNFPWRAFVQDNIHQNNTEITIPHSTDSRLTAPAPVQTNKSRLQTLVFAKHQRATSQMRAPGEATPEPYGRLGALVTAVKSEWLFDTPALVKVVQQGKGPVSHSTLARDSLQNKTSLKLPNRLKLRALAPALRLDGLFTSVSVEVKQQRKNEPSTLSFGSKSVRAQSAFAVALANVSHSSSSTYQRSLRQRNTRQVQGPASWGVAPLRNEIAPVTISVPQVTKQRGEAARRAVVPSFEPAPHHQDRTTSRTDKRRPVVALLTPAVRALNSYQGGHGSQPLDRGLVSHIRQPQDNAQASQPLDYVLDSQEWQPQNGDTGSQEFNSEDTGPAPGMLQSQDPDLSFQGLQQQKNAASQERQSLDSRPDSRELQPLDYSPGFTKMQSQNSMELLLQNRGLGSQAVLQPQVDGYGSIEPQQPSAGRFRRRRSVEKSGPSDPASYSALTRYNHNPHAPQPRLCCLTYIMPAGTSVKNTTRRCMNMDRRQLKNHICFVRTTAKPSSTLGTTAVSASPLMSHSPLTGGGSFSSFTSLISPAPNAARANITSSTASSLTVRTARFTSTKAHTSHASKPTPQTTPTISAATTTPFTALTMPSPHSQSSATPQMHSAVSLAKTSTIAVVPQTAAAAQKAVRTTPWKQVPMTQSQTSAPPQATSSSSSNGKSMGSVTTRVSTRRFTSPSASPGLASGAAITHMASSSTLYLPGVTSTVATTVHSTTTATTPVKTTVTVSTSSSSPSLPASTSGGISVTTWSGSSSSASKYVTLTSQFASSPSSSLQAVSSSSSSATPSAVGNVTAPQPTSVSSISQGSSAGTLSPLPGTFTQIDENTSRDDVVDFVNDLQCNVSMECVSYVLLHPDLSADVKIDLLSELVTLPSAAMIPGTPSHNSTLTSDIWKQSIKYFLMILNSYLGGTYFNRLQLLDNRVPQTLLTLERFLERVMARALRKNIAMQYNFSHLEFQIQKLSSTEEMRQFQYQDPQNTCSIREVQFAKPLTTQQVEAVLVSVVMQVPHINAVLTYGGREEERKGIIGSSVLLFSGYVQGRPRSLKHSFKLRHHLKDLDDDANVSFAPRCVFLENKSRMWSTFGCEVVDAAEKAHDEDDEINNKIVGCRCNHTSNFAILMQVVPFKVSGAHRVALSIITYIGCSITLITMFMAVTVFTSIRSLNCERVCVHRNLCLAIVGAQITFLAGIEAVEHRLVCAVVALLLHYCYTAVFIWMLVEGLHLYLKVVTVFGTERSRVNYYICFGWGVPLVLVSISAAADWEGYGTPTSCWLSTQRNTIWAFVGPALAIIFVNLVILGAVVKIVMASARLDQLGKFDHIRAGVKAALLLLPLLGLTWIFGLAAVNKDLIIFQYLFAFFNTLQGFFIFLFHCVFNTEVRQALRRLQEKRSLLRGDLSTLAGFTSSSPSVSPTPSVLQEQKKPLGRIESPTTKLPASYKQNRVVPARYTSTTNIVSTTVQCTSGNTTRDRRSSNQHSRPRKTQEMNLMFV